MSTKNSNGIMLASQVCERLVLRTRPEPTGSQHYRQASNYFTRPPLNITRRSPEEVAASAEFAREACEREYLAHRAGTVAEPTPARAPTPKPAPAPVFFAPEPEPEPEPRIEIDPEVVVSWGTWSRAELYEQAQELEIRGRSSMTKRMLLKALVAYVRGD